MSVFSNSDIIAYGGYGMGGYGVLVSTLVVDSEHSLKERLSNIENSIQEYETLIIKKIKNGLELNQAEAMFLMGQQFNLSSTLNDIEYTKKQNKQKEENKNG